MPNKDSFTFSDKLKKSKSLPLSKRIPSKVGGDGKAKRTLIQRAQRDLPFIIVAAAALLLLPILSRNSGTDDLGTETPMDFVAPDTSGSDSGGLGQEIAPSSGFKNPLDWIVSRSGKDTEGNRDSLDAGEEDGGYDATTPPYTSSVEGSGDRATEKYAPAAKGAVRNALVRKATEVAALRNSKTVASGASTGVSRSLATGSAASGGGAGAPRVGVRPVALQPMASAGKGGRSETGEGLYAEAARSLAAMNRGGSKQALFDAQLKNVDGTPLGSIGGGPNFGAGAGKLGAGGAPSNNVGYKPYLPWWWDFEKQKAMKMWELWNYNFQKALSDNIIKVGTSLALCLTTGSADGKVDKFLGDPGGSDDYSCPGGKVLDWSSHRDLMGKEESGSGDGKSSKAIASYGDWVTACKNSNGGKEPTPKSSGKKDMLDVRLRCLGFKYKNSGLYKRLSRAEYGEKDNCIGVSGDSGLIKFELTSTKDSKKDLMGHYVVAKDMKAQNPSETVIYIAKGGKLDGVALRDRINSLTPKDKDGNPTKDFVVTKVIGFTTDPDSTEHDAQAEFLTGNPDKKAEKMKILSDMTDAEKEKFAGSSINTQVQDMKDAIEKINERNKGKDASEEDKKKIETLKADITKYEALDEKGKIEWVVQKKIDSIDTKKEKIEDKREKASEYKYGKKFRATVASVIARIDGDAKEGRSMSETYVQDSLDIKVQKSCSVGTKFYGTKMTDMHHSLRGSSKEDIVCGSSNGKPIEPTTYVKLKEPRDFSVTIEKPGACIYAVVVERSPITKDKFIVKRVVNFQNNTDGMYKSQPDEGGKVTVKFDSSVGIDEASNKEVKPEEQNGNGWVYWITNNACDGVAAVVDQEINPNDMSTIVNAYSAGGQRFGVCHYRWACETGGCISTDKPNAKEYCKKSTNGQTGDAGTYDVYEAVPLAGNLSVATGLPIAKGVNGGVKASELKKSFGEMPWFKTFLKENANGNEDETLCMECFNTGIPKVCTDVCADPDGNISIKIGNEFKPAVPAVNKKDIPGLTPENCPDCKPEPEVTGTPAPKSCEFSFYDTFVRSSFNKFNNQNSNTISEAVSTLSKCISNKDVESHIVLYVTGFTDNAGESEEVEKECLGGYCLSPEDPDEGAKIKSNPKNFSLSEDRAKYIAETIAIGLSERHKQDGLQINLKFAKNPSADKVFAGSYLFKSTVYGPANNPKKILDFIIGGVGSTHAKYAASEDKAKLDRKVLITVTPIFVGKEIK